MNPDSNRSTGNSSAMTETKARQRKPTPKVSWTSFKKEDLPNISRGIAAPLSETESERPRPIVICPWATDQRKPAVHFKRLIVSTQDQEGRHQQPIQHNPNGWLTVIGLGAKFPLDFWKLLLRVKDCLLVEQTVCP